jgi:ferritin-like metal-binding protein YciE
MPAIDTLEELLKHELKDLYSAEAQIIEALPEMIDTAKNPDLKKALKDHLSVTKAQKERLNKIQELLGEEKQAPAKKGFFANLFKSDEGEEHCKAMAGLVKEGNALLQENMDAEVMDAAIIAAAQKIEHYEIASYGTARAYALQLQLNDVAKLLEQTLNEEYAADDLLTKLALGEVNLNADPLLKSPEETNTKSATKAPVKSAKKSSPPKKAKASKNSSAKKNSKQQSAKK